MQPTIDQATVAVIVTIAAAEALAQKFKKPVVRLVPDETDPRGKHLVFKECDCVHEGDNVCIQHNGITVAVGPDVDNVRKVDATNGNPFFHFA